MGSLKSPCMTSCRSSIALNCLVFEKIAFLQLGDRQMKTQTNKQMDMPVAWSRSRCHEWRLNANCAKLYGRWVMCASDCKHASDRTLVLISINWFSLSARHQRTLQDHRYGLVYHVMCLFTARYPAYAGTHCTYSQRDGQAEYCMAGSTPRWFSCRLLMQVLTGPSVVQVCWLQLMCYHSAKAPPNVVVTVCFS